MKKGKLTVITGCMFSGKTTRLISRAEKALKENKNIEIFYPEIDTRYEKNYISSHDAVKLPAKPIPMETTVLNIEHLVFDMVFIDELHFFQKPMILVIQQLLDKGIDVIISGLDRNYRAEGFGIMPDLIAMADEVVYLKAWCTVCGKDAIYTYRVNAKKEDETIIIGGVDLYEARCEQHYIKPE